jgi:nanoRNase/pAp phosphatase (c-di-AMP/oligoRNAs hydrolase)
MIDSSQKYRLITRSDFDGLVTAVLLKELGMVDEVKFVHPKDMQDGKIEVSSRDITTNLPFVDGVHMAFDHHSSETSRIGVKANYINAPDAASASRVVFEFYGGKERFANISDEMMIAVDKADSAKFTREDVLHPQGWELLSFITDARTGLGRFREFRISNYALMMELIDHCRTKSIGEIMALPDVKERTDLYLAHQDKAKDQILRCATVHKNLVVLDLQNEDVQYATNRFMVYALFPQTNISIHVMWGFQKQNIVFATGKSIFDRTSKTDVGELMLKHGGGGHVAAGTCQIPAEKSSAVLQELIKAITQ